MSGTQSKIYVINDGDGEIAITKYTVNTNKEDVATIKQSNITKHHHDANEHNEMMWNGRND